jgi:hypothetical protein
MTLSNAFANPSFVGIDYIGDVTRATNAAIAKPEHPLKTLWNKAKNLVARPQLPVELVYISDNGHTGTPEQPVADQAADEIKGRLNTISRSFEVLSGRKPNVTIRYQDIASQDTLGGAAALRQSVVGEVPVFGRVVFLNVAPRKSERGVKKKNGGEKVFIGLHQDGTLFAGTGEHCFSFFKKDVEQGKLALFQANVAIEGSQFRSRDFFPWLAFVAANALPKFSGLAGQHLSAQQQTDALKTLNFVNINAPLRAENIPDVPNNGAVASSIDVHGNVKTALTGADLDEHFPNGGDVYVLANDKLVPAQVATASFDKSEGSVVLSRGSTYRDALNLGDDTRAAVEIFKVGARIADVLEVSAAHLRKGLEFHVLDATAFDAAFGDYSRKHSDATKLAFAKVLAAEGFVKGLDNSALRAAVSEGTFEHPVRHDLQFGSNGAGIALAQPHVR